jgi:hypothetical protein
MKKFALLLILFFPLVVNARLQGKLVWILYYKDYQKQLRIPIK